MTFLYSIIAIVLLVLFLCLFILLAEKFLGQSGEVKLCVNKENIYSVKCGSKLLNTLTDNNIYLPATCGGKGNCGRCKIKVLKGGGYLTSLENLILDKSEINGLWRLACQVKIREDIELELSKELLHAKSFEAKLIGIKDIAYKIKSLEFKLENNDCLDFKAGQYIQIVQEINGENVIRAYSISSSPIVKDSFSLDIQLIEDGLMSNYLHNLELGAIIKFCGPFGDMAVDYEILNCKKIVMVAGGVGLAPMRSICSFLKDNNYCGKAILLHGARSRKNLYNEDEYRKLSKEVTYFEYVPILSEPSLEEGWLGKTGLVTEALKECLGSNTAFDIKFYLCGPTAMMDSAKQILFDNGIKEDQIQSDPFSF